MMHVAFRFSLLCVFSVHGLSLRDALVISECLETCKHDTCRHACNRSASTLDQSIRRIDEDARANVSLHCRRTDTIKITYNPGTYIIEERMAGEAWNQVKVCNGIFCTFKNLTAGSPYQFRVHRLYVNGISQAELSETFFTFLEDYKPKPILNVSLNGVTLDEGYDHRLRAKIDFEPSEDRTCDYYIRTWGGEHDLRHYTLQNVVDFQFSAYVDHDKTYQVNISAENRDETSDARTLKFSTPPCQEINHKLDTCSPSKVQELEVTDVHMHGQMYNLVITWKRPEFLPNNFTIMVYQPEESARNYATPDIMLLHKSTIPGNFTRVVVSNVKLRAPYEVCIFAEGNGGISPVASITNDKIAETNVTYDKVINGMAPFVSVVILIGILCGCYCKGKNKQLVRKYMHFEKYSQKDILVEMIKGQEDKNEEDIGQDILRLQDKFHVRSSELIIRNVLGSGAYGIVRFGMLRGNCGRLMKAVAVKTLKEDSSAEDVKNFQREIEMMKCAGRHPNIVSLIGYCTLEEGPALIVEYCYNGDLQSYLRKIWTSMTNLINDRREQFLFGANLSTDTLTDYPNAINSVEEETTGIISNRLYDVQQDILQSIENVTAADLLNFARQVATGMDYLSSCRIIHRDLAARNVLVCADGLVKISDFGLSRDVYQEDMYKKRGNDRLPIKWLAMECLTHQVYTTHSDVWSFGILLWEIITLGGMPYPTRANNEILKILKSGYRLERPPNCSIELYNLMLSCWNVKPRSRPPFHRIKQRLGKFLCDYFGSTYMNLTDAASVDSGGNYDQWFVGTTT